MSARTCIWSVALLIGLLQQARAGLLAYEGFDYLDGSTPAALASLAGGTGFTGGWFARGSNPIAAFSVVEGSLATPAFPFTPIGDQAFATGPGTGSNNNRATRTMADSLNLGTDGSRYFSFLMNKATNGGASSDNQEFDLISGASQTLRLGSTSDDRFWLGATSNHFEDVVTGQTYFLVVKVAASAAGSDVASMLVYDPSEAVPVVEPASWDATHTFNSAAVVDSIELWMGTVASGAFDEIRSGDSWADVAAVPEPATTALVALGAVLLAAGLRRGNNRAA